MEKQTLDLTHYQTLRYQTFCYYNLGRYSLECMSHNDAACESRARHKTTAIILLFIIVIVFLLSVGVDDDACEIAHHVCILFSLKNSPAVT